MDGGAWEVCFKCGRGETLWTDWIMKRWTETERFSPPALARLSRCSRYEAHVFRSPVHCSPNTCFASEQHELCRQLSNRPEGSQKRSIRLKATCCRLEAHWITRARLLVFPVYLEWKKARGWKWPWSHSEAFDAVCSWYSVVFLCFAIVCVEKKKDYTVWEGCGGLVCLSEVCWWGA